MQRKPHQPSTNCHVLASRKAPPHRDLLGHPGNPHSVYVTAAFQRDSADAAFDGDLDGEHRSTRRSFTQLGRNRQDEADSASLVTGHRTRESYQIYSHTDEAVLRDALAKLPRLTPDKP